MAIEYELTVADYISIFKRRWPLMLAAGLLVLAAAVATAILLPPVYQSIGTILIESQQIPTDLVKASATSYADERIQVIKQRVMTRDTLYRIIQKYHLYPNKIDSATTSDLIGEMRDAISVELLNANSTATRSGKATIAFKVGFEYQKPEIAHKVANELVTLFLDENVRARTARATETTEFLTEELNRLKAELEDVESKVAVYKQQNANSLPEHLEMHMGMIQRGEQEIQALDREYKSTQEELRYLDVELASARVSAKSGGENSQQSAVSELDKAKAELERSLVLYKESHPTVRALKRRVETLEKTSQAPLENKPAKLNLEADLITIKVQTQVEAAKVRLSSIVDQKRSTQAKMEKLQSQVVQSPQIERTLFSLMRDYENAKSKYEEVKSKQVNAKIAENLEQENKAERFVMLEPPIFPDKPSKPDRKKIIALGIVASIASALALVALLETLNNRVRGVESLTAIIGMRPLVVIPYITTQAELRRKKNLTRYVLAAVAIFILISLLITHFLIVPVDLLFVKLMARFA